MLSEAEIRMKEKELAEKEKELKDLQKTLQREKEAYLALGMKLEKDLNEREAKILEMEERLKEHGDSEEEKITEIQREIMAIQNRIIIEFTRRDREMVASIIKDLGISREELLKMRETLKETGN